MNIRRLLVGPIASIVALSAIGGVSAASPHTSTQTQQKIVGGYRLVLETGPAHKLNDMGGSGIWMTVGGKAATCLVPGQTMMGGMNMKAKPCNRLISVHVFNAKTNKIVLKAHVVLTMRAMGSHMTISVPVMMMLGTGGMRDFQYGNDIIAAAGTYTIAVTVNSVHTTFTARLT